MLAYLTFQYTWVHRRPNRPGITVNSNCPKSRTSHPLILILGQYQIYDIMLARVGWFSSIHCHSKLPHATKNRQADYPPANLLTIYGQFQAASLLSWVGGVVIIKLKANLSSTGPGLPTELGTCSPSKYKASRTTGVRCTP